MFARSAFKAPLFKGGCLAKQGRGDKAKKIAYIYVMRNPYPYPPVTFGDSPLEKGAFKGEILVFRAAVGVGVTDDPN